MARQTIRHECGHTSRVDVGNGPASSKALIVFQATLRDCPTCEQHAETEVDFIISHNARIEGKEG